MESFAFTKLWNIVPKCIETVGHVNPLAELEIRYFIDNFIIESHGNVIKKLDLINIMFGRWKYIPMEACITNCRHFLQAMNVLYPDRTTEYWNGCICNVRPVYNQFTTLPKWSEECNYLAECEEIYWVKYRFVLLIYISFLA